MKLLSRLRFALTYDFGREFIVFSIPDQLAYKFLKYEDAKKFSDEQIQYRPNIMVAVKKGVDTE